MRVHILIITCIFNDKNLNPGQCGVTKQVQQGNAHRMTGRTCLMLQDGVPDPAAAHTGRRAELSEGKGPDLLG